jgi:hypothetical protein
MLAGELGQFVTPNEGRTPLPGVKFGADNGCFSKNYVGDERWFEWLGSLPREGCLFAVAPDVVGDAQGTLARSLPWLPQIRSLGFPAAFVAQDGLEDLVVPWDWFDVLFIGGSTEWKLSTHAPTDRGRSEAATQDRPHGPRELGAPLGCCRVLRLRHVRRDVPGVRPGHQLVARAELASARRT